VLDGGVATAVKNAVVVGARTIIQF
jgi:hypothetical protein